MTKPRPFRLNITEIDGRKVINFANNSSDFVEVVFTINGKEAKEGKLWDPSIRGYGYPPKLEKPVKQTKNGAPLHIQNGATVKAYVLLGIGKYKDEDFDQPAFLRHKLAKKFIFRRTSYEPIAILEVENKA